MPNQNTEKNLKTLFRLLPVAGVLCLITGFVWAIAHTMLDKTAMVLVGVGILLFLTLFVKAEVANIRYYIHVFVYSILVLGICLVIYLFARQYTQKIDLTKQQLYSLSASTTNLLKDLKKDVKVTIFDSSFDRYQEIIDQYKPLSEKLSFETVNARQDPTKARSFGDNVRNGDVFVACGENKKKLAGAELLGRDYENTLSNAIMEVSRDIKPKLYFLTGHGEVSFESVQPSQRDENIPPSLGAFRKFLNDRGMETIELSIPEKGFVPKDAALLVIAGPKQDLLTPEVTAIEDYLKKDGKLLVMLDVPAAQFGSKLENLRAMLGRWGVDAPDDKVVVDMTSARAGLQPVQPLIASYDKSSPITSEISKRPVLVALGLTRPLEAGKMPEGLQGVDLIESSPQSWAGDLTQIVASNKISPPEDKTQIKPQVMGMAISKSAPPRMPMMPNQPEQAKGGPRIVVFGTSELIQDSFLTVQQAGVELMLNTINWLNEQEDQIAAPPRQIEGTPIVLNRSQLSLIFFFAVVVLPAALFFGGVSYSMLRRKK